jgi:hypothetical protein
MEAIMATENLSTNEPEQVLDLYDLTNDLDQRLRWARATVGLIVTDPDTEDAISNAADAADAHLGEARKLVKPLYHVRGKPAKPRDLRNGQEREDEKVELLHRLRKLSWDDVQQVMFTHMYLHSADEQGRAEGLKLIERGQPLAWVQSFMALRKDGLVQLREPVDAVTAADVALDTFQVEASKLTAADCAKRLREFEWAAKRSDDPDGTFYRVSYDFTPDGLKRFLAEREFLQSLLPDEGDAE